MARRVGIQTAIQSPGLRPAAGPRDDYRPIRNDENIIRIARALRDFSPSLRRAGADLAQLDIERDQLADDKTRKAAREAAVQDAEQLRAEAQTYREGRQSGDLNVQDDPFFMVHYEEKMGQLLARRAQSDWLEFRTENLDPEATMEEYDAMFQNFLDDLQEAQFGDDVESPAQIAFNESMENIYANDRLAWASQASYEIEERATEVHSQHLEQGIHDRVLAGDSLEEVAAWATEQQEAFQEQYGTSPTKRRQVNDITFLAIQRVALHLARSGHSTPTTVFDELRKNASWGPNGEGNFFRGRYADAAEGVYEEIQQIQNDTRIQRENEARDALQDHSLAIRRAITSGAPQAEIRAMYDEMADVASNQTGTTIASLRRFEEDWQAAPFQSDPAALSLVRATLRANRLDFDAGMEALDGAIARQEISWNDYRDGIRYLETWQARASGEGGDVIVAMLENEHYLNERRRMDTVFNSEMSLTTEARARATEADAYFEERWLEWRAANPDARGPEQREFLKNLRYESWQAKLSTMDLRQILKSVPMDSDDPMWSRQVHPQLIDENTGAPEQTRFEAMNAYLPPSMQVIAVAEGEQAPSLDVSQRRTARQMAAQITGLPESDFTDPSKRVWAMGTLSRFLRAQSRILTEGTDTPVFNTRTEQR